MAASDFISVPIIGSVLAEMIVNIFIVCLVLAVVALRVHGRLHGPGVGWDDLFVIVATPLGVALVICQGFVAPRGSGYDLNTHPEIASNLPSIVSVTFAMALIYVLVLWSIKCSMLFFYLRVFATTLSVQRLSRVALAYVSAWAVAFLCTCIFICDPVPAQWDPARSPGHKCGSYNTMAKALIATNIVSDVLVIAIPMRSIWKLQIKQAERLGIMGCFALAGACVIIAIFRLIYLAKYDFYQTLKDTMSPTVFLFVLEPNMGILCVSIPMLRPLFNRYRSRLAASRIQNECSSGDDGVGGSVNTRFGLGGQPGKAKKSSIVDVDRDRSQTPLGRRHGPGSSASETLWEMDDYHRVIGLSRKAESPGVWPPDGSSRSELMFQREQHQTMLRSHEEATSKSLQSPAGLNNAIRVERQWSVMSDSIC